MRSCHDRFLMKPQYTLSHRIVAQIKPKTPNKTCSESLTWRKQHQQQRLLSSDQRSSSPPLEPSRRRSERAPMHPNTESCTAVFVLLRIAVRFPSLPASIVRLTGAGDCLVGGMLASICAGLNLMQSVVVGIAAAKAVVEAETSVPTAFSLASIAGKTKVGEVIGVVGKD